MLQAANTDLFDPLVPKAHKSECQNQFIVKLADFIFCTLGSNELKHISKKARL